MTQSTDSREPNALTFDEIVEMQSSWHDGVKANEVTTDDMEAWVEHMRAGDFAVGHFYEATP